VNTPAASQNLSVHFLAEGEQRPVDIATMLANFLREARHSLDIAIYDFRLSDPLRQIVASALAEAAAAGAYGPARPISPTTRGRCKKTTSSRFPTR
jgi:hypothetical protein